MKGMRSAAGPRRSSGTRNCTGSGTVAGPAGSTATRRMGTGGRLLHCCIFPAHLLQLQQMKMAFPVPPFPVMVLILIIILYLREGDLLQNRNHTATQQSGPDTQQCLHNSQFAANENRSPPKPAGSENIAPSHPPIDCCTCSKPAANVQQTTAPAAKDDRTIRARDYKPLEPPELKTLCFACRRRGSWYVEKLTPYRNARPREQQDARRICKACYKEAVRAEQMASVPLPGTIDVSRFQSGDSGGREVLGVWTGEGGMD